VRILRSEWLKVVSVPTSWILLGTMLLIEGLFAGLVASLGDIDDLRKADPRVMMLGTSLATVLMFTLGALLATNEYRHGTANQTFVITPRRERVIGAKLAVGLAVGVVAALLYITVNAGLGLSILSKRGVEVDGDLAVNIYSGVGAGLVLGCLFGVALGALLRNQILTIVVGLLLFSFLRGTVALIIGTDIGKFFPGEALLALQDAPTGEDLLSQVDAGLVLAATCIAVALAGIVMTREREIT